MHCAVQLEIRDADWKEDDETRRLAEEFCEQLKLRWERLRGAGKHSKLDLVENEADWIHYICREEMIGSSSFCTLTTALGTRSSTMCCS